MRRRRTVLPAAAAALALSASGCDGGSSSPAVDQSAATPEGVTLSFMQLRIDEGTPRAQLRVVNASDDDLAVSGIGLDWPGYGRFVEDHPSTVPAGRTLDLRLTLPEPADCGEQTTPVVGLLETPEALVSQELDESGAGFVTRAWQRRCNELQVEAGVELDYGPRWRLVGDGREAHLAGTVVLAREEAPGRVAITGVQGTVLFDLVLPRRAVLEPGSDRVEVPLEVRSFRCDDHAVGESSQSFHFRMIVRFDDEEPFSVLRFPGARIRELAQQLVTRACG